LEKIWSHVFQVRTFPGMAICLSALTYLQYLQLVHVSFP